MLRFYKKSPISNKLFNAGIFKVRACEFGDMISESQMSIDFIRFVTRLLNN